MTMQDWAKKLNAFLQFNERDLPDHPGKVSAEVAKAFAENEFETQVQAEEVEDGGVPVVDVDKDFDWSHVGCAKARIEPLETVPGAAYPCRHGAV